MADLSKRGLVKAADLVDSAGMKNWCRTLARIVPALWLGAGLAVSFVAIPVVFSPPVRAAIPRDAVGQIAQTILGRFFVVQLIGCGLGLLARWGAGDRWGRWERNAWVILAVGSVVAAGWLYPKLQALHQVRYDLQNTAEVRDAAAREFGRWHGGSQAGNLLVLLTLGSLVVAGARPRSGMPVPKP